MGCALSSAHKPYQPGLFVGDPPADPPDAASLMEPKVRPESAGGHVTFPNLLQGHGFDQVTAQAVRDRIHISRDQHAYAAEFYRHRYFLLSVPSVMLAALIGVVEVVVPGEGPWRKTFVAVLSALNTCLLTISNMYGFQSVKDQHFQAAKLYSALLTEFDYTVWFPGQQGPEVMEKSLKEYLGHAEKKIGELVSHMPPVPTFINSQVRAHFRTSAGGTRSTSCDGREVDISDPALERLRGFADFMPALGAASVATCAIVWSRGGEDTQLLAQGVSLAVLCLQNVILLGIRSRQGRDPGSTCAQVYGLMFGPEGVASVAMLTWSLVRLFKHAEVWQLAFALPQSFALMFAIAQKRSPTGGPGYATTFPRARRMSVHGGEEDPEMGGAW